MRKLLLLIVIALLSLPQVIAQSLAVTWGANGIQTLSYNGATLINLTANPGDGYSIRHMRLLTAAGTVDQTNGYNYGDGGFTSRTFSSAGNVGTWTTVYPWGQIVTTATINGNHLDWSTTATNNSSDPDTFYGAAVYLSDFRFPALPGSVTQGDWGSANAVELSFETLDFGVMRADWGTGLADHVDLNPAVAQYTGWLNDGSGSPNFYPVQSTVMPDGVPAFEPSYSLPVAPGSSITYSSSIRFAPSGTSRLTIDGDVYAAVAATRPYALGRFTDRRPMGDIYLSSNGTQGGQIGANTASGCTSGPNYWNYLNAAGAVDCTLDPTTAAFQTIVLNHALQSVQDAFVYGWQGLVTWDLEGQKYTQPSSYVCSPDQVATIAPPMELTVSGQTGNLAQYNGMKLDDAFFAIQTSAGLKVGLCVRPQQYTISADASTSNQVYLSDTAALALLKTKLQTITSRWGATIAYMDTFVHADGGYIDTFVLGGLNAAYPQVLLNPEYQFGAQLGGYLQFAAPLASFLNHGDLGTAADFPEAAWIYPNAFMVNIVNDVAASTLSSSATQLQNALNRGDVFLLRDFAQPNNPTIQQMYNAVPRPSNALLFARRSAGAHLPPSLPLF